MATAKVIHATRTISVTDLRRDPSGVLESAGDMHSSLKSQSANRLSAFCKGI